MYMYFSFMKHDDRGENNVSSINFPFDMYLSFL